MNEIIILTFFITLFPVVTSFWTSWRKYTMIQMGTSAGGDIKGLDLPTFAVLKLLGRVDGSAEEWRLMK